MKEAAGEANMTVITIVLIAVVLGVGIILVPKLMSGTSDKACCTSNGGVWDNSSKKCYDPTFCKDPQDPTQCDSKKTISKTCD